VKRDVFNCLLKEAMEVAVVTLVGRLFHERAAVTRKDRSLMVRSHVRSVVTWTRKPGQVKQPSSSSSAGKAGR